MARPRHVNPSPAALRKRAQRARKANQKPLDPRLVELVVYVPRSDVKIVQTTAQRLRAAARIPESEVPSEAGSSDP